MPGVQRSPFCAGSDHASVPPWQLAPLSRTLYEICRAGLFFFYNHQVDLIKNLTYKLTGLRIIKLDEAETILSVGLQIASTSTLEAEITNLNLDFYINGVKLANITDESKIVLPAKGYSNVQLKIAISPKDLKQNFVNLASYFIQNKDAVVRFTGYGKVKTAFITTTLPFEYETTIKELTES